jgi:5-methylcytosine-specific restriction endonuclease McrA
MSAWAPDKLKHPEFPPLFVATKPCANCETMVTFKRYWGRDPRRPDGGKYNTPLGACPSCKKSVYLRVDGTQKSKMDMETCPKCDGPKKIRAKECRSCFQARTAKTIHTSICAYRECGQEFRWSDYNWDKEKVKQPRRFCSDRCGRNEGKIIREEHRKQGIVVAPRKQFKRSTALSLAYRYGYYCHICNVLIDVSRVPTDAMSLTIDHVVALAAGGDDSSDNLRPAHRSCNSKKGAR